jgi:hypothetical protein
LNNNVDIELEQFLLICKSITHLMKMDETIALRPPRMFSQVL